jgi:hypothetical protein
MKLIMGERIPDQWKEAKGTTYETRYLYTGFGRFNEFEKTLETIQDNNDGTYDFFSRPHTAGVFSRVYNVELVRITLYSVCPRIWSETVFGETFFFQAIEQDGPHPSF